MNADAGQQSDIVFEGGRITSRLRVTKVAARHYRIEEPPTLTEEAQYRDIIEAEEDSKGRLLFRGVVEKSDWKSHSSLCSRSIVESPEFATLLKQIQGEGGYAEVIFGGLFRAYVPRTASLDLEQLLAKVIASIRGQ